MDNSQNKNLKTHILLVEDDYRLIDLISEYLQKQGFAVSTAERGDIAVDRIITLDPDLVILDLMLPGMDGLSVCREVRHRYSGPILMLTAREDDIDQVAGLEMGADDYVKKPIEPRVLLARIRALLRRSSTNEMKEKISEKETENVTFGQLQINMTSRRVTFSGELIDFTSNEYELLLLLVDAAGTVVDRDFLFKSLRGIEYDGLDRSIDVSISRLRKKLGDSASAPFRIKTVWGKGYLFVPDAWN